MKRIDGRKTHGGLMVLVAALLMVGTAAAQSPSDAYLPTVLVGVPNLSANSAKILAPTFTIYVNGTDPDSQSGLPAKWRMLMVSAQYGGTPQDPQYVRTPFEYELHGKTLVTWDHPDWSEWLPYSEDPEDNKVIFPNMNPDEYYLFALQVMDEDGAVSIKQDYNREVMNFQVRSGAYAPEVDLCEPFLGCDQSSTAMYEIAAGQPLNFSWTASADFYAGEIVSYRHGWDLVDPDDPNDPGWAVPPGTEPQNLFDTERSFQDGIHSFFVKVIDNSGQERLMIRQVHVIPFVDVSFQLNLLLIDQTIDDNSNRWLDQNGNPRDNEIYRNSYWYFLNEGPGGVSDMNWSRDFMDQTEEPRYSDVVKYKVVMCFARFNEVGQRLFQQFRAEDDIDKYVWLTPYQERGGNFFLVGGRSMDSFLEGKPNYMIPTIFDTDETSFFLGGTEYEVGFGQSEQPDGSLAARGVAQYPYATAGIAALDWTSPNTKTIYGRTTLAKDDRDVDCVGLKAIVLDPGFKSYHGVAPGAIPDTIYTDADIDWQDPWYAAADTLGLFHGTFPFRDDEFVDANITTRSTPLSPQGCDAPAPNGLCVEPMWRGVSRFDWMREYYFAKGESDWPFSQYTTQELEEGCGELALASFDGVPMSSSRTNDRVYGYFSWKKVQDKPAGPQADVYWGFDPYRFDHDDTQDAIRWVLQYFGLNINP